MFEEDLNNEEYITGIDGELIDTEDDFLDSLEEIIDKEEEDKKEDDRDNQ